MFKPKTKHSKKYNFWVYGDSLRIAVEKTINNIKNFSDDSKISETSLLKNRTDQIKYLLCIMDEAENLSAMDFNDIEFDETLTINQHYQILKFLPDNNKVVDYIADMEYISIIDCLTKLITDKNFYITYSKYIKNIDEKRSLTSINSKQLDFNEVNPTIEELYSDYLNVNEFLDNFDFIELVNKDEDYEY